jgi:hypothetical protein
MVVPGAFCGLDSRALFDQGMLLLASPADSFDGPLSMCIPTVTGTSFTLALDICTIGQAIRFTTVLDDKADSDLSEPQVSIALTNDHNTTNSVDETTGGLAKSVTSSFESLREVTAQQGFIAGILSHIR